MTDTITAAAFALFTITGVGKTDIARFDTEVQCATAAHLALTGITAEEDKAQAKAVADLEKIERERREAKQAAWDKAHPPRQAQNDEERKAVSDCLASKEKKQSFYPWWPGFKLSPECVIQDAEQDLFTVVSAIGIQPLMPVPRGVNADYFVIKVGGRYIQRGMNETKYAYCITPDGRKLDDPVPVITY